MPESQQKKRQAKRLQRPDRIEPLNRTQANYLTHLAESDCVIATGPAGTGKTFLACAYAAELLATKKIEKVLLTRPTVGVANRTLGFLPGDIKRKMQPWARPLVDAFKRILGSSQTENLLQNNIIEIAALEHMRGLTFDDAYLIIDEGQNASVVEMKAFLTRIGMRSRVVVCGDVSQSDLVGENGLSAVVAAISRGLVPSARHIEFDHSEVVRSQLCAEWTRAFDVLALPSIVQPGARGAQLRGSAVMP